MLLNCRAQSKHINPLTSENSNSTSKGIDESALADVLVVEGPEMDLDAAACIYSMQNVRTKVI